MQLPLHSSLEIHKLNKVFEDTTNSYKFYWLLGILELIKNGKSERISMEDLSIQMVARVWYPLDYFKLSFGKQDGFKKIADFVSQRITVNHREKAPELFNQIKEGFSEKDLKQLTKMVKELLRWVPFRFVRPFFKEETRGEPEHQVNEKIILLCHSKFVAESHRVIYKFEGNDLVLNPQWADYLKTNYGILQGFTLWHLTRFLQKHNPNIPGISEKLSKSYNDRNLKVANNFWKPFLVEMPEFRCIYSDASVSSENFSLDHFLPWSFVVHNLTWNLVPVPKSVNSSKSDWLPDWNTHFHRFAESQFQVVNFHLKKGSQKLLEDYVTISLLNSASNFREFREKLSNQLLPQFQIAQNSGFTYPYIYRNSQNLNAYR